MKTELSAAKLYHQHFLKIAQYNYKQKKLPLKGVIKEALISNSVSLIEAANTPANWDESWFANYE